MIIEVADQNFDYDDTELTVTGSFGDIQIGASYEFKGRLTTHARYGVQFAAQNYQRQAPVRRLVWWRICQVINFRGLEKRRQQRL